MWWVILWQLLHVTLYAVNNEEILARADASVKSASKTELFRAYNDYKNLYLRALMDEDTSLTERTLRGIVASGTRLHIDVSHYRKELARFDQARNRVVVPKSATSSQQGFKPLLHLQKSYWEEDRLILLFDRELQRSDIKYFTILDEKKKNYRYIFDIVAIIHDRISLSHQKIDRISLAQYNLKTIRLVIGHSNALALSYELEGRRLMIATTLSDKDSRTVSQATGSVQNKPSVPMLKQKYTVVIDPGHGGKDAGAVGYKKYREKSVVFRIAGLMRTMLEEVGIKVYLTRTTDEFVSLRDRTKFANDKKADLFVSIHANSVPSQNARLAQGIETYFLSPSRSERAANVAAVENSKEIEDMNFFGKNNFLNFLNREKIVASNKLAIDLQRGMLASVQSKYRDVKDNGVREGPFWVLVGAQMPAVLVEVGFISHYKEAERMVDPAYQKLLAEGMTEGIVRYFKHNP
ncbi:MAG: N-acetylmuramoyl-L-alanine amidase [Campylobacterales bacterium]|nr:N-acetylmuramoyl-L-alanine amidase [Campylobacterales bacterium]